MCLYTLQVLHWNNGYIMSWNVSHTLCRSFPEIVGTLKHTLNISLIFAGPSLKKMKHKYLKCISTFCRSFPEKCKQKYFKCISTFYWSFPEKFIHKYLKYIFTFCRSFPETIDNLGVNHTIKNGFGISRQESVVIIINQIVYLEILSQMSGRRPSLLETRWNPDQYKTALRQDQCPHFDTFRQAQCKGSM